MACNLSMLPLGVETPTSTCKTKLPKGVPRVLNTVHSTLHEMVTLANPQLGPRKFAAGVRQG